MYNLLSLLKRFLYILAVVAWLFVAALGLSLVAVTGGCSSLRFTGFSSRWLFSCGAQAVGVQASVVAVLGLSCCSSWAPELALSSGAQALSLCSMWESSPTRGQTIALQGRFSASGSPGKPQPIVLKMF